MRIERSARHGGVVEIEQSLSDGRVIGGESERSSETAGPSEEIVDLLALRIGFGLLQIREASSRLRIEVGRQLRLRIGADGCRGREQNRGAKTSGWGMGHM